jgi:hypothetical protein
LVTVTAYALTTEQNERLLQCNHEEMVGLVVEISCKRSDKYPIRVDWINPKAKHKNIRPPTNFFFRELKRKRT